MCHSHSSAGLHLGPEICWLIAHLVMGSKEKYANFAKLVSFICLTVKVQSVYGSDKLKIN